MSRAARGPVAADPRGVLPRRSDWSTWRVPGLAGLGVDSLARSVGSAVRFGWLRAPLGSADRASIGPARDNDQRRNIGRIHSPSFRARPGFGVGPGWISPEWQKLATRSRKRRGDSAGLSLPAGAGYDQAGGQPPTPRVQAPMKPKGKTLAPGEVVRVWKPKFVAAPASGRPVLQP